MGSIAENGVLPKGMKLKDSSLFISKGLVNGKWKDAASQKTFPVFEPSTGDVLHPCADMSLSDFQEAIDSASDGYLKFFNSTTAKERGAILRKWFDLIIANIDDIAVILCLENGKMLAEAKGEVAYAASFVSWFAEESARSYGDTIPSSMHNTVVLTMKDPVGVCGIITPWNFPAAMITRKIAPAFAAGCSVVIKPPSETPFTALALAKLALDAGIPPACLHVIPTKDRQAATELATNPKVNKLSFTGSTGVGKMLTKLAAGTMKKVSMELGGNAPYIVFDDANLDRAIDGVMIAKFRSSGQTCICANRILVQSKIAPAFTQKLIERVKALKVGPGMKSDTTQGPLVNKAAVEKVAAHVKDALSKGAKLETGGKAPDGETGFYYEPTVITGVTNKMEVAYDETFGPLAPVFIFDTEAEGIAMANDTEFGLASYIFSQDIGRVMRVGKALQCGMVGVNTGAMSAAETPFGGIKESGVGREGSKYGLAEYQNIKSMTIGNLQA